MAYLNNLDIWKSKTSNKDTLMEHSDILNESVHAIDCNILQSLNVSNHLSTSTDSITNLKLCEQELISDTNVIGKNIDEKSLLSIPVCETFPFISASTDNLNTAYALKISSSASSPINLKNSSTQLSKFVTTTINSNLSTVSSENLSQFSSSKLKKSHPISFSHSVQSYAESTETFCHSFPKSTASSTVSLNNISNNPNKACNSEHINSSNSSLSDVMIAENLVSPKVSVEYLSHFDSPKSYSSASFGSSLQNELDEMNLEVNVIEEELRSLADRASNTQRQIMLMLARLNTLVRPHTILEVVLAGQNCAIQLSNSFSRIKTQEAAWQEHDQHDNKYMQKEH